MQWSLDDPNADLKPSGGFFWLWIFLTFVWIATSSSLAVESVVTGALISAALAYGFAAKFEIWRGIRYSPSRLYHFIRYTGVFVVELVRANLNMMRYVYAPRISVNPGVVKVRTGLKSPIGRLALANSISLTPGSLVLDVAEDGLVIHCLDMQAVDPDKATQIIAGPFEDHLERTFG
jgi:multicomponent Na+:H+ antiporter subunit E